MHTNEKTIDTNICGHSCFFICVNSWNGSISPEIKEVSCWRRSGMNDLAEGINAGKWLLNLPGLHLFDILTHGP